MFRKHAVPVAILAFGLAVPATLAVQDAPAAGAAAEETPARADLTEANDLVRERDFAGAEEVLDTLAAEFPEDPVVHLMLGEVLLALGDPEGARDALATSAGLDPERPRVQFQLASALAALGETDAALEAFARELAVTEDAEIATLARLNRSLLLQRGGDLDGAAAELEAVLELRPDRLEVWGDLATLRLEAGALDAARDALDRGAAAGFASARHRFTLGAALYRADRHAEAVEAFRRALELDPGLADAERSLAAALDQLDRRDEAVAHLRRYLELRPDAPDRGEVEERIASGS